MTLLLAAIVTTVTIIFLLAPLMREGGRQAASGWLLLVLLTMSAMGLYLWRGSPGTPSIPALFDQTSPQAVQRQLLRQEQDVVAQLKKTPDDPDLMLQLGELRMGGGRLDAAIDILSRAHERHPGHDAIAVKLGAACYAAALAALLIEDDRAQAENFFKKAMEIAPEHAPYRQKLEDSYREFQEEAP